MTESGRKPATRLRTLALLELVNVGILGWATFGPFRAAPSTANLVAFGLVAAHLVVGAGYWAAKRRQVQRGLRHLPSAHLLAPLRRGLVVALVGGAAVIAVSAATAPPSAWLAAVVLYLLALAEHVNYFHWQLMYDNRADLRRLLRSGLVRSHLWTDATAAERARSAGSRRRVP